MAAAAAFLACCLINGPRFGCWTAQSINGRGQKQKLCCKSSQLNSVQSDYCSYCEADKHPQCQCQANKESKHV